MKEADQALSAQGLDFFGDAGFVVLHSHCLIVSVMTSPLWAKGKAEVQKSPHQYIRI
jgi:hypothetical protein